MSHKILEASRGVGADTILLYKVISVFLSVPKDLETAEPILFSFTVKLLIGPGKVLNFF